MVDLEFKKAAQLVKIMKTTQNCWQEKLQEGRTSFAVKEWMDCSVGAIKELNTGMNECKWRRKLSTQQFSILLKVIPATRNWSAITWTCYFVRFQVSRKNFSLHIYFNYHFLNSNDDSFWMHGIIQTQVWKRLKLLMKSMRIFPLTIWIPLLTCHLQIRLNFSGNVVKTRIVQINYPIEYKYLIATISIELIFNDNISQSFDHKISPSETDIEKPQRLINCCYYFDRQSFQLATYVRAYE